MDPPPRSPRRSLPCLGRRHRCRGPWLAGELLTARAAGQGPVCARAAHTAGGRAPGARAGVMSPDGTARASPADVPAGGRFDVGWNRRVSAVTRAAQLRATLLFRGSPKPAAAYVAGQLRPCGPAGPAGCGGWEAPVFPGGAGGHTTRARSWSRALAPDVMPNTGETRPRRRKGRYLAVGQLARCQAALPGRGGACHEGLPVGPSRSTSLILLEAGRAGLVAPYTYYMIHK